MQKKKSNNNNKKYLHYLDKWQRVKANKMERVKLSTWSRNCFLIKKIWMILTLADSLLQSVLKVLLHGAIRNDDL